MQYTQHNGNFGKKKFILKLKFKCMNEKIQWVGEWLIKLHSEFMCGNISRPFTPNYFTFSNEDYRRDLSISFVMLHTHLQVYTIITWVYLVLWILCKFVESSKQIYLIQTKYTHGGFWRSTRRNLDLKERDVCWAFNLLLNI